MGIKNNGTIMVNFVNNLVCLKEILINIYHNMTFPDFIVT